jgi:uncharacterized protein
MRIDSFQNGTGFERKTVLEYRAVEDRLVTGFPSVFGVLDDGGDIVTPGAYAKTIVERGQRMRWLWQHDSQQPPIARVVEIAEVGAELLPPAVLMRWPEAAGALMVKREYLDTPRGNEVLIGIRAGAINEMSIGYDAIQAEKPRDAVQAGRPVRRILKEIRLWEMSDVLWGMNAATANLKELMALRPDDRSGQIKAMAEWIESRIHLSFTEIADGLFGDGLLTREERIALSGLIGDALGAFNAGMASDPVLAGVRERERWEPAADSVPVVAQNVMAAEMMRRRLAVARKRNGCNG